jgi:hypothetical protein
MIAHQKVSIFSFDEPRLAEQLHERQTASLCHTKTLLAQVDLRAETCSRLDTNDGGRVVPR